MFSSKLAWREEVWLISPPPTPSWAKSSTETSDQERMERRTSSYSSPRMVAAQHNAPAQVGTSQHAFSKS